jgi:flavin-binding protein dodecin
MSTKVYKKITVVGCSAESYEQAIEAAVEKAAGSVHGLAWFEVTEMRGAILDGKPSEWQATVEVGFRVD